MASVELYFFPASCENGFCERVGIVLYLVGIAYHLGRVSII